MNLYTDRISELHDFLASRYGQRDTQATEILLAAQLPVAITRARRPWIILETDYPSRDTTDAWFSFGTVVPSYCLSVPRVQRHDPAETMLESWIADRQKPDNGMLFVEPEWRKLVNKSRVMNWQLDSTYALLMSMCVRVRVAHPRGEIGLQLDRTVDKQELARLTRRVYSDRDTMQTREQHPARKPSVLAPLGGHGQEADRMTVPPSFLYWCEMLQKLAPRQHDWESLTGQIASVAHGISYLYNDGRAPAWDAAERLIRDMIPATTAWIIQMIASQKAGLSHHEISRGSRSAPEQSYYKEVRRLRDERVIVFSGHKYRLGHADWRDLIDREKRILV